MSLFEAIGVALILPFLAVVGNPDLVHESAPLRWVYIHGGFASEDSFMFALGVFAFCLTVFAAMFRSVAQFAIFHFASMRMHTIGMRLLQAYLSQPYAFFLRCNTSDISKRILSDVQLAVENSLLPGNTADVCQHGDCIYPYPNRCSGEPSYGSSRNFLIVCGVYGIAFYFSRKKMDAFGEARNRANEARFAMASEAFADPGGKAVRSGIELSQTL